MNQKKNSNHFYIQRKLLNLKKYNKYYKFRRFLRHFLKTNLYRLIRKKILFSISFKNSLVSKINIKFKNKKNFFFSKSTNLSRNLNQIFILKDEKYFNKKSYNLNKYNIKKIFIINKKKKKSIKFKKKMFIYFFFKNIKMISKYFRYYKTFFNLVVRRKEKNEIIFYKSNHLKNINHILFDKIYKKKKINFFHNLSSIKFLNYKKNNNININNMILKKRLKYKYILVNLKKNYKISNRLRKSIKLTKIVKTLVNNINLVSNLKNIINLID